MIITTEELKKLIDGKKDFVLIDVRRQDELHYGMIPTAHHIPLHDIEEVFDLDEQSFKKKYGFTKPTPKKLIVVYCRSGGRSSTATSLLTSKGYTVKNYKGSVGEWSKIDPQVKAYGSFFY